MRGRSGACATLDLEKVVSTKPIKRPPKTRNHLRRRGRHSGTNVRRCGLHCCRLWLTEGYAALREVLSPDPEPRCGSRASRLLPGLGQTRQARRELVAAERLCQPRQIRRDAFVVG